jgi:predicted alpha/beta-hydrolase family hydrolase
MTLAAAPALGQRLPRATLRPPPPGPTVADRSIEGVSIRIWQPGEVGSATRAILFSHGAFSDARAYDPLAGGWALEGHLVAAVSHGEPAPGSPPDLEAARAGWRSRLADMRVVAAELARLAPGRPLIAAGHSYGALVAQALGGARVAWEGDGGAFPMPGVTRILAFSPPGPVPGLIAAEGWAETRLPMFVATGTADIVPPVSPTWEAHKASFEASNVSPRWLWVGDGVDHYFGNRIGRPERLRDEDQARLFEAALSTSLAFLEEREPPEQPPGATLTIR